MALVSSSSHLKATARALHACWLLRRWQPGSSTRRTYSIRAQSGRNQGVTTIADLKSWKSGKEAQQVEVCGWVRSVRKSSQVRFVDIFDGSSMRPLQAVITKELSAEIRPGAAMRFKGSWHNAAGELSGQHLDHGSSSITSADADPTGGSLPNSLPRSGHDQDTTGNQATSNEASENSRPGEFTVSEVELLGPSDPQTNPMQHKYHSPETLRKMPHLRSRTPINSTILRLRSDSIALLNHFFFQEKFQQTHPPIITSSDCEGAGEAFAVQSSKEKHFFNHTKYLTVSTQLHLEALAQSLGNVWTLSPTFRAEQSDTSRHLSEFYMLEAEMSFIQDMDVVMDFIQRMLASLVRGLQQLNAAKELDINRLDSKEPAERLAFEDLVSRVELQRRWRGLLVPSKWPRITYSEAIEILRPVAESNPDKFEHTPMWGAGLQSEHEKYLARHVGYDPESDALMPVFITHYPRDIKAFYMPKSSSSPSQGETVDCFDLIVADLGELAGGSMREHRLTELQENMRLHGMSIPTKKNLNGSDLDWYLDLRRWGCPPHGGFGMGFDRLLSYLTGVPSVRDVVPFPRHHGRCDC
ncbi:hypothetical protein S40288_04138 [Stachybotrys chartarum IBT 40288]|nr:hypothetical protein S40288_04138 [Stachybotrys chartarum IBT 40288]